MVPSFARLNLIVLSTAAYLGLAVLGGGGPAAFFSHSALRVLAAALFVIAGAALFAGGNLSSGVREDRANRWVIAALRAARAARRVSAGLHGPDWVLDPRRRQHPLAWRRSLYGR